MLNNYSEKLSGNFVVTSEYKIRIKKIGNI